MKSPGIHYRLIVSAFFLICATTVTLDLVGVQIVNNFLNKRFKDRIAFLAKYLAMNSEVGVLIGDKSGLSSLALNLLGEEDVARVIILDNQNTELVNLDKLVPGPLSEVEMPVQFRKLHEENILFETGPKTPFGKQKIPGSELIGKVRVQYSTYGNEKLMREITKNFVLFSSGIALFSGLLFYFISRPIVMEVKYLANTVEQVGRGDLELRAKPGKLPETRSLTLAFNTMLDSLENSRNALERVNREMIRQKMLAELGKFSMMIAHEFKNPLGIIKSSLDILKKDHHLTSEDMMVDYIEDEIFRLNRLIEEFLLFSQPAKPNFRIVDSTEMLMELVERFRIQYSDEKIAIHESSLSVPIRVKGDRDLLTRCLNNIIKNACEASEEEGIVQITSLLDDNKWVAIIEDGGNGIEEEYLEKIFEPFFTTKAKGTGLGLAFSAQVVRAHGGTIIAKNREAGGAQFRLEIPAIVE
jgi:signal transduction histidine kinase